MHVRLYGLKNCDTCRKALRDLEAAGISPEFIDLRATQELPALLPSWIRAAGERLINRSSTTWRGLSDAQKAEATSNAPGDLILSNPTLIRRPVITVNHLVLTGWNDAVREQVQQALRG